MMAKKKSLAVLVAMAAMTATTAVPAFAQEEGEVAAHPVGPAEGGQYAPVGETQQEAAPALDPVAGSGQYAPATSGEYASVSGAPASAESGEQTIIKGVFSVEEGGWSFVTDAKTGQPYYLVGVIGVDPEATAGKTVIAKGIAECGYDGPVYGCTLGVSSITPTGGKGADAPAPKKETVANDQHGQKAASSETTAPAAAVSANTVSGVEQATGNGAAAVVSGDTSNADKGGGSVDVSGSGSVDTSGGAAKSATSSVSQGAASPIASVLPATGGVLPIAGLAGLAIVAAGLLVRRISR